MKTLLIEPTDVLFFRDAIPMTAGQGKGAGCRMPFPSTAHEAFRASLLRASGGLVDGKREEGRPRAAARKGNWHAAGHDRETFIATRAFRSLQSVGPLPWHAEKGLLLPVPLDVALTPDRQILRRLQLWRDHRTPPPREMRSPSDLLPSCLPMATTPAGKHSRPHGWWTVAQVRAYLRGDSQNSTGGFEPVAEAELWEAEHRIGVEIDPESSTASQGQLYAGSYLRADSKTRFAMQLGLGDPRSGESQALDTLDWLLLGGEFRLARLWRGTSAGGLLPDYFKPLAAAPEPPGADGPCLVKWVLITPGIFTHGSLPGWCADTRPERAGGKWPPGRVCLELPGRAQLISWCLPKPRTISGWDVVDGRAKPTQLAVPEGAVYYFLCEDRLTAAELARKLHWHPRSDFYGEKGCGYGLASFDVQMHPTSMDVPALAKELFNC